MTSQICYNFWCSNSELKLKIVIASIYIRNKYYLNDSIEMCTCLIFISFEPS